MRNTGIKNIVIIIVVVLAGFWLIKKIKDAPSLKSLFTSQPVVIDQTPILIKEIKTIAQLVTVTSYDEVVVDSIVYSKKAAIVDAFRMVVPFLPSAQKQLVLVGKGKVLAGTNLQKLQPQNIIISNDTITLNLPPAEILETIINPSDFETFVEQGVWTDAEVTQVKLKARNKIINRALNQNILNKADNKAKSVMENFLRNAGYKVVYVQTL